MANDNDASYISASISVKRRINRKPYMLSENKKTDGSHLTIEIHHPLGIAETKCAKCPNITNLAKLN